MAGKIIGEPAHDGQVLRITLNAPKGNILDGEMMAGLQTELDGLKGRPEVKLLLITGAGDHFSFGASVEEHTKERAPEMLRQFHGLFRSLVRSSVPAAAVVSGQCLGGGFELALACHFLFVDETARLGCPEIQLGVFAPPASLILPMKIGQARADDLLLTGRSIKGADAAAIGLATTAYGDRESMEAGVDEWIGKHILPRSASSLRFAVRAAQWRFHESLLDGLERLEGLYTGGLMETEDGNEGILSFLERRKPEWKDR
ncbi:MAG: enoyl-CoA hydratase/isomerase family protein [Candidatus Eisenbacteria bacterium]